MLAAARFGPYSIYATQKDFVERGEDILIADFDHALQHDPLLHRSAGPEQFDQLRHWYFVLDFLRDGACSLPTWPSIPRGRVDLDADLRASPFHKFKEYVQAEYGALPPERRTLVINLFRIHDAGVLLPLMLVTGRCSGEEYAEALLAARGAHPATFEPNWEAYKKNLGAFRADAYTALEYIAHYYNERETRVRRLVREGESMAVEFKSTLRMNLRSQQKDPEIEHAALKAIAAFLNTEGGTLLIGVDDSRTILGIEADEFQNRDHFERHFTNLVRNGLGVKAYGALRTSFETLENHDVFMVSVRRGDEAVYLKRGGHEDFYVRTGPQTVHLSVREAVEYIQSHFR